MGLWREGDRVCERRAESIVEFPDLPTNNGYGCFRRVLGKQDSEVPKEHPRLVSLPLRDDDIMNPSKINLIPGKKNTEQA
jgi:hypothetical protein